MILARFVFMRRNFFIFYAMNPSERNHFRRLLLANIGNGTRELIDGTLSGAELRRQQQPGTCTQHNQNTLPQLAVRFSISLFAENKGLNVSCGK
jgi:hypothetical protein